MVRDHRRKITLLRQLAGVHVRFTPSYRDESGEEATAQPCIVAKVNREQRHLLLALERLRPIARNDPLPRAIDETIFIPPDVPGLTIGGRQYLPGVFCHFWHEPANHERGAVFTGRGNTVVRQPWTRAH